MDEFDDLDVSLIDLSTNQAFPKHNTKKTVSQNSCRSRIWAVEAEADQRFAVEIRLKSTFEWADSNCLEVKLRFDIGEQVASRSVYILRSKNIVADVNLPHFSYTNAVGIYRIDHVLNQDMLEGIGNARRCYFYFRHLRPDKFVKLAGRPRILGTQGSICVEMKRHIVAPSIQDRGLQAHVRPQYSRQTQHKLEQQKITLEVLLRDDPTENSVEYEHRFRPCLPRPDLPHLTFVFMYRETGFHQPFIPLEDIDEIRGAVPESAKKKQACPASTKRAPLSRISTLLKEIDDQSELSLQGTKFSAAECAEDDRIVIDSTDEADHATPSQDVHSDESAFPPHGNFLDEKTEETTPASGSESSRHGVKRGLEDLLQDQIDRASNEVQELKSLQRQIREIEDKYRAYQNTMHTLIRASRESEATRRSALHRFQDAVKEMNANNMMPTNTQTGNRDEA